MQYVVKIDLENTAMQGGDNDKHEVARILRKLADDVEKGGLFTEHALRDSNGNLAGTTAVAI